MWTSPLHRYRIPLAIASWLAFAISLAFYWITADPAASYWDCPEYVTVASKMEVGHPPGNPIWMLAMRMVTMPFSPQYHAYVINLSSGILMAFAVFFLCRLIFIPSRLFLNKDIFSKKLSDKNSDCISILVALGASLCFAFCDSTWYSALEAEVYAMSTFLSALSLWIMTLWWWAPSRSRRSQLLILLAYIQGLSLGVHQLNLLLIPVYAIVILYKSYPSRINPIIVLATFLGSVALIGVVLLGFIPGILFGAGKFELWAVNGLGLPYNSGVILFCGIIFILFLIFQYLVYNYKSGRQEFLSMILWSVAFLFLGFSSFGMIMIRSMAAPPMNEAAPDNIFALSSYIGRDQYPSSPLLYGQTPYSQPMFREEFLNGEPYYSRYVLEKVKARYQPTLPDAQLGQRSALLSKEDTLHNLSIIERGKGYLIADYDFRQMLTPELNMWFPRITSRDVSDRDAYVDWAGASEETMDRIMISETLDTLGFPVAKMNREGIRVPQYSYRPTYLQNLRYFISYQSYYMYFRYLFWNFIGRQNDYHSMGEIEHGNFITGFPIIDSKFLGSTEEMPSEIGSGNRGRNIYFGVPFILGIIGIGAMLLYGRKSRRLLTLVSALFLMTGLAIVAYLNQSPGEPRERDYTFIVSYLAFAMWIGAGMFSPLPIMIKKAKISWIIIIIAFLSLATPALMAFENFDDHDRRGRFETSFYASSILDFEYPSIIFTHGDNLTFPVWYANEVLEAGKNHTPIDITYLSMPNYVTNLKKQGHKGVTTIGETPQLAFGKYLITRLPSDSNSCPMPLKEALKALYENDSPEWPTSIVIIKGPSGEDVSINLHDFSKGSSYLSFKHLMLLDILASQSDSENPRFLYFPTVIDYSFYKPITPFLKNTFFGKIYAPDLNDSLRLEIMRSSVNRELHKLSNLHLKNSSFTSHYADPVIGDISRRYRGELIIAAEDLLMEGDTATAANIADSIIKFFPYRELLPGSFTMTDSLYYEGKGFSRLLKNLSKAKADEKYAKYAMDLDSLMQHRYREWLLYYHSLTPQQRATLSNRSLRMLKIPDNYQ